MCSLSVGPDRNDDFDRRLGFVARKPEGSQGVFAPSSLTWRVNREAAIFLGAGRAILLQLAHPWVSTAIAQHSTVIDDPVGRFHRTFTVVFSIVFGSLNQALAAARRLHLRHSSVTGVLTAPGGRFPKGSEYSASNLPARQWVYATLTDTALTAYELVLPPLSMNERERYYEESKRIAALYGIPPETLPVDWAAFTAYCEAMWHSDTLAVTDCARVIAGQILHQRNSWVPVPGWYRALTAHLLPPRLRREFDLTYAQAERRSAERAIRYIRGAYELMPYRLRYVGPYYEAVSRIAGSAEPDLMARWSNRFWIGQPAMPKGGARSLRGYG